MKEIFNDILGIDDVHGAMFIADNNEIKIQNFAPGKPVPNLNPLDLAAFINTIGANIETEIHFDKLRLYIRKIQTGHLLILTGYNVQMALVRLNCDVLEPLIKSQFEKPSGIGRFFKK